jgi:2-polyprenyl-3-methyl-5-hydroxy-6-metoxy-1,4-benzoquinol methylase
MLNYLRKLTHLIYKKESLFEIEQKKVLSILDSTFLDDKSTTSYWLNKTKFSKYLSPKRIAFTQSLINIVARHISLDSKSPLKVCDVSFGSGYLLFYLFSRFPNLHLSGTELNHDSFMILKTLIPSVKNIYLQNIYELDLPKQDILFCTEVLEHLAKPELALKNLLNCLKESGTLIITVPNGREDVSIAGTSSHDKSYWNGHINFWSPESWEIFINRECENYNTYFFIIPDLGYSKIGVLIQPKS